MHHRGFIHRDISPSNILIGQNEASTLYLVDFGSSKRYVHPHTKKHIQMIKRKSDFDILGTHDFASLNSHYGQELSRRDDLISLGYALVFLAKRNLPWSNVKRKTQQKKLVKVQEMKEKTSVEELCIDLPCKDGFLNPTSIDEFMIFI